MRQLSWKPTQILEQQFEKCGCFMRCESPVSYNVFGLVRPSDGRVTVDDLGYFRAACNRIDPVPFHFDKLDHGLSRHVPLSQRSNKGSCFITSSIIDVTRQDKIQQDIP